MPSFKTLRTVTSDLIRRGLVVCVGISMFALPISAIASGPTVSGRIVDAQGKAIEGAAAELIPMLDTTDIARLLLDGQAGPLAVVRTDANPKTGIFRVEAPDTGIWRLRVSAPGHLALEMRLIGLVDDLDVPTAHLEPAIDVGVRLVTSEGEPVPGAALAIYRPRAGRGERGGPAAELQWHGWAVLATTGGPDVVAGSDSESPEPDAVGVARFRAVEGEKVWIQAVADGQVQLLEEHTVRDGFVADLTLEPGTPTLLRVSDAKGRPMAGVYVREDYQPIPVGVTDQRGQLQVTLAEQANLWLFDDEGRWQKCNPCKPVDDARGGARSSAPAAKKPRVLDLELRPPSIVRGTVVDELSGDAIGDALVWPHTAYGRMVKSAEDGSFELLSSNPRSAIRAIAPGYLGDGAQQPRLADGVGALALHLRSRSGVSGRVVDADGQPAAGVDILPLQEQRQRYFNGRQPWVTTDAKGRFQLDGLRASESYQILLWGERWSDTSEHLEPLEPGEQRHDVEWRVSRGLVGMGRVVDESDQPVANAMVHLEPSTTSFVTERLKRISSNATDVEGFFEIFALEAKRYDLRVEAAGFATANVPGVKALVEAAEIAGGDQDVDLGVITLSPGVPLSGDVKNRDGEAIVGALITIVPKSRLSVTRILGSEAKAQSDDSGHFRIADRRGGETVTLNIEADGYRQQLLPAVKVTGDPLTIVLDEASRVTGRVVDEAGRGVSEARVFVKPRQRLRSFGRTPSDPTDTEGRFEIDGLETGEFLISAMKQGFRTTQAEIEITDQGSQSLSVELVLVPGMLFQGTILDPVDQPLAHVSVHASRRDESYGAVSDAEGRFDLTGLSPGRWQMDFRHPGYQRMERELEMESASAQVFRFPAGVEVSGSVLDNNDEIVTGCSVSLQTVKGHMSSHVGNVELKATEGFVFANVPEGSYALDCYCQSGGATCDRLDVTVGSTPITELVLRLPRGGDDTGTLIGVVAGLPDDDYSQVRVRILRINDRSGFTATHHELPVDFEGGFEVEGLPHGRYRVSAGLPSGATASAEVELAGDEARVELRALPGFRLSGVLRPGGTPAAAVTLHLDALNMSGGARALTDPDGRFVFPNVAAGRYQLMAPLGDGFFQRKIDIDSDLEIILEPAVFRVSGRVTAADDRGIATGYVSARSLEPGSNGWMRAQVASGGSFSLQGVEAGRWRLTATLEGIGAASVELNIEADVSDIALVIDSGSTVEFQLIDAAGSPAPAALYAVTDATGSTLHVDHSAAATGRHTLQLPKGSQRLWLQTNLGMLQGFDLPPGGESVTDLGVLQLAPTATLRLESEARSVLDPLIATFSGANATPMLGTNQTLGSSVPLSPSMAVAIFPGSYVVTLSDGPGNVSSHEITAVAGQETVISVP